MVSNISREDLESLFVDLVSVPSKRRASVQSITFAAIKHFELDRAALRSFLSQQSHQKLASLLHALAMVSGANKQVVELSTLAKKIASASVFPKAKFQLFFKAVDSNRDGFITSNDLNLWACAAGVAGLLNREDIDNLFNPNLPDFNEAIN